MSGYGCVRVREGRPSPAAMQLVGIIDNIPTNYGQVIGSYGQVKGVVRWVGEGSGKEMRRKQRDAREVRKKER